MVSSRIFLFAVLVGLLCFSSLKPALSEEQFFIEIYGKAEIIKSFGPVTGSDKSFHYGIDIAKEPLSEFLSPVSGQVSFCGFTPVSSETLTIRCENGYLVTILNLSKVSVRKGDIIARGDLIGFVSPFLPGSTETPHVHISIRDSWGNYLDPLPFLRFNTIPLEKDQVLEERPGVKDMIERLPIEVLFEEQSLTNSSLLSHLEECPENESVISEELIAREAEESPTIKAKPCAIKNGLDHLIEKPFANTSYKSYLTRKLHLEKGKAEIGMYKKNKRKFESVKITSTRRKAEKIKFEYVLLLFNLSADIILRLSLLPALAGGRLSPKGGESFERVRNNVYREASAYT